MEKFEVHKHFQELALWLQTPEGQAHVKQIREDVEKAMKRFKKDSEIPYHILIQPMTI